MSLRRCTNGPKAQLTAVAYIGLLSAVFDPLVKCSNTNLTAGWLLVAYSIAWYGEKSLLSYWYLVLLLLAFFNLKPQ